MKKIIVVHQPSWNSHEMLTSLFSDNKNIQTQFCEYARCALTRLSEDANIFDIQIVFVIGKKIEDLDDHKETLVTLCKNRGIHFQHFEDGKWVNKPNVTNEE